MGHAGTSGANAANKFTDNNPEWNLFNVVPAQSDALLFIFEREKKVGPKNPTPTGGTEAALLTESTNVVQMRRAA